jgi:hypothetical protein
VNEKRASEETMHTSGNQDGRVHSGITGWISVHVHDSERTFDLPSTPSDSPLSEPIAIQPALIHLFEHAESTPPPLPELFPRLTFLAIAVVLLVTAVTAEFEYLRGAGYFWP